MLPSISICIPAYKRTDYIKRLLDSLLSQTYKKFEVIITDDSPDISIQLLCKDYHDKMDLRYFKNSINLNTPANWNEAISKSRYEWIKLIHDDDWFASEDSLAQFATAISNNPDADFFFSAYSNIYEANNFVEPVFLSSFWMFALKKNIEILISRNVIGPPSVTLYRKNKITYDNFMKFVVDIDFYCQYCKNIQWEYINKPLINVGINKDQVTKYTFGLPDFHLKESLLMLEKKELSIFRNIFVYDAWWRLIRNFKIKNVETIVQSGYVKNVPSILKRMILQQSYIPLTLLRIGLFSKIVMIFSFLLSGILNLISQEN
jgi:glycosyltransferase involved in cell wall biosynthesis